MGSTPLSLEGDSDLVIHAHRLREEILAHPGTTPPEAEAFLARCEAAGAHDAAALVHGALASAYREAQRYAEAMTYADRAVTEGSRGGDDDLARALAVRAMVHVETGGRAEAQADLARAGALNVTDPTVALGSAVVAHHCGDYRLARSVLADLVSRSDVSPLHRMMALNNLGDILLLVDDTRSALGSFREALEIAQSVSPHHAPFVEVGIGSALAQLGDLGGALAAFRRAETDQVRLTGVGMDAEYHAELAALFGRLRLLAEARTYAQLALDHLSAAAPSLMIIDAMMTAARLALLDGDEASARDLLARAETGYAAQGRPVGVAMAALERLALAVPGDAAAIAAHADALGAAGMTRAAARGWLRAASAAWESGDGEAARALWERSAGAVGAEAVVVREAGARHQLSVGAAEAARTQVRAALAEIDAQSALAGAPDLRHRMAADRARFELLLRQINESDSAAAQLDAILRGRPPAVGAVELSEDEEQLRSQWRELSRRIESADESPADLVALGARLADTERALRAGAWGRAGAGRDGAAGRGGLASEACGTADGPAGGAAGRAAYGLTELAAHVAGPLLVLVRVGEEAVAFGHAVGVTTRVVLGPWRQVTEDLAQLSRGLARVATGGRGGAAYAGTVALAAGLDAALGACLSDTGDTELLVLLDRSIDSAPLTALPRIWRRPVRFASLAVTAGRVGSALARSPVVLVAAGPRLDHAAAEAEGVGEIWAEESEVARPATGMPLPVPDPRSASAAAADTYSRSAQAATVRRTTSAVRGDLLDADIVHVAAHASLRWDNPMQSVIHLDDGPLALTELAAARGGGPLRLLYLSACSLASAPTDDVLVGAMPMLAEHVAHEVLASSIPLPDAHAPGIAYAVHRALRSGRSPAAGLADARGGLVREMDTVDNSAWAALACLAVHTAAP
ncbi:hypothetical protein [Nostocoides veronense]|uniref:CHAT domain-containing protein n=1 Tax=Nostocoides veronense TaxID=330836 RepID=A0ABN2LKB3_9MICO